jgi:beta-lysine 5,6-aminomutase alpha subunit
MESIAAKVFADVRRSPNGGRGFDGVFARGDGYWNPFEEALSPQVPAGRS